MPLCWPPKHLLGGIGHLGRADRPDGLSAIDTKRRHASRGSLWGEGVCDGEGKPTPKVRADAPGVILWLDPLV
jgi:hypothetical protein